MRAPLRLAPLALLLALCACHTPERVPKGAVLLFDADFSAPEQTAGQEVKVVETGVEQTFPSRIPSQVFFGHPTVVQKLCGLDHQPLQLSVASGEQGLEGLEFLLSQRYGHYHVELDLCVDRMDPPQLPAQNVQLAVFLDFPDAYALGFVSGGEIGVIDPLLAPETTTSPRPIGRFELGKPVHVAIDVDLEQHTWRFALDGKTALEAANQSYLPRAIRVLVRGNPTTRAAFDNFLVWAEHDVVGDQAAPEPPITGPEK